MAHRQTSHKNFTSRLSKQQHNNLTSSLQAHRYLQLPFTSTRFQTTSVWHPPTQPTSPTAQLRRSRPSLPWEARLLTADMAVVLKSRRYHIFSRSSLQMPNSLTGHQDHLPGRNADGTFTKGSEAAKEAGHLGGLHSHQNDGEKVR